MVAAGLWLALDGGVVVGDVAYPEQGDAEHDAEVLRVEAREALGYPVAPGQIEVRAVRVVTERRFPIATSKTGPTSAEIGSAFSGPTAEVDPFAPPEGYR